jgi:hypothetical protein
MVFAVSPSEKAPIRSLSVAAMVPFLPWIVAPVARD